jgi:propanol-preferring alcohol dehydrogenase
MESKAEAAIVLTEIFEQGDYSGRLPMIPGHENVGTVAVIGLGVKDFEVGDRVGVSLFQNSCGIL